MNKTATPMAGEPMPDPAAQDGVPQSRERLAPVGNRGTHETSQPGKEYPGGDRGAHSGVNQRDQEAAGSDPRPRERE